MTDGFWQSLKLDVLVYSYKCDAWGQHNGNTSTHVLCECEYMCVCAGRWAGMYIFERDKEIILYKGWNMLRNVFIYWPSIFLN